MTCRIILALTPEGDFYRRGGGGLLPLANFKIKKTSPNGENECVKYVDIYVAGYSDRNQKSIWVTLLRHKGIDKIKSGFIDNSNVVRAVMTAIAEGLKSLKEPCNVTVYTEFEFIPKTFELGWKRQKNSDLWGLIDIYGREHVIQYKWFHGTKLVIRNAGEKMKEGGA